MKPRPQRLHHGLWIGRYGIHFSYSTRDQRCVMFVSTPEKGQFSETIIVDSKHYDHSWRKEIFKDFMGVAWDQYCECHGYAYSDEVARQYKLPKQEKKNDRVIQKIKRIQ